MPPTIDWARVDQLSLLCTAHKQTWITKVVPAVKTEETVVLLGIQGVLPISNATTVVQEVGNTADEDVVFAAEHREACSCR